MTALMSSASWWWLGTAIGGGAVLLLAEMWMRRMPTPDARQRLGEWGVLAALAVAVLRLAPPWLPIPIGHETPVAAQAQSAETRPTAGYTNETARVFFVREHGPIEYTTAPAAEWLPNPAQGNTNNILAADPISPPSVDTAESQAVESAHPVWTVITWGLQAGMLTYLFVAGGLLVRWLCGQWALARLVKRSTPARGPVQQLFDVMAQSQRQPVRLCVSDQIPVPVCWGLRRPVVVLPRRLAEGHDMTELRWVFAHELTHLARRDPWSSWAFGLAQVVYFYLPWFWWVKRQVRLCQEYVADAAAAAQGRWADEYAQFLVNLARSPAAPVGATGVMGNKSDLYRRITMVLQKDKTSERPAVGSRLATAAGCLVVLGLLSSGVGVSAQTPKSDKKEERVEVKVIMLDDDAKDSKDDKQGKKDKKEIRARTIVLDGEGGPAVGGFDPAAIEKRLREALKKADLSEEQIEKIVKDVRKGLHQRITMNMAPAPAVAAWTAKPGEVAHVFALHGMGGGRLGVMIEPVSSVLADQLNLSKEQGLVIREVMKGSAAEKAGLKANDILLRFDGNEVKADAGAFVKMIDKTESDNEVEVVVLRKGKKEVVKGIKLSDRKDVLMPAVPGEKRAFTIAVPDGAGVGKGQRTVTVNVKEGEYSAKDTDGEVTITITGKMEDGKVEVSKITVNDGESKNTYDSVENVPAKYRERVKKTLANTGDPAKFEIRRKKVDE